MRRGLLFLFYSPAFAIFLLGGAAVGFPGAGLEPPEVVSGPIVEPGGYRGTPIRKSSVTSEGPDHIVYDVGHEAMLDLGGIVGVFVLLCASAIPYVVFIAAAVSCAILLANRALNRLAENHFIGNMITTEADQFVSLNLCRLGKVSADGRKTAVAYLNSPNAISLFCGAGLFTWLFAALVTSSADKVLTKAAMLTLRPVAHAVTKTYWVGGLIVLVGALLFLVVSLLLWTGTQRRNPKCGFRGM